LALRPRADEIIRGIEHSLAEHVLPEVRTPYAVAQLQYALGLLHTLKNEWDGAAQRLVEDNRALRAMAARLADTVAGRDAALAGALRGAAAEGDPDLRLTALGAANDHLRALHARALAVLDPDSDPAAEARRQLQEGVDRRMPGALRPR
jgi:hypothetical protein